MLILKIPELINLINKIYFSDIFYVEEKFRALIMIVFSHSFNAEIGDLLSWLSEVDGVIAASKPVGGLPETASEQLERFMVSKGYLLTLSNCTSTRASSSPH